MERKEEYKRRQKKITEEAEQRSAPEFEQKKNQRILREVEKAQTQALLQGISKTKGAKQKGYKEGPKQWIIWKEQKERWPFP